MKKNIGEFSLPTLLISFALCLIPGIGIYKHFSFQRFLPTDAVTSRVTEMQKQIDDLTRALNKLAAPAPPPTSILKKDVEPKGRVGKEQ
jgi:hypothetical protein